MVWSPLASGLLTGKYDHGVPKGTRFDDLAWLRDRFATPQYLERVRSFKTVADELGVSRAQLALAWAAAQPGVSSVITGATRLEQLQENLGALDVKIPPELLERLNGWFPDGD